MNAWQRLWYALKRAPTTSQTLPAWRSGRPMDKEWDSDRAIKEGAKVNVWVYAAVSLRAEAISRIPWRVMTRTNAGDEWKPEPGHPLETLIEYPNARMTRQDVIERLVWHLDMAGNAIWTITFGTSLRNSTGKTPLEMWPMNPGPLKPIPDREKFISGYEYWRDGVRLVIPSEETLHWMFCDPSNPYWGMSPLQAAARVVDTDVAAVAWNKMTFETRAIPETVFTVDRPLTRQEWEEAREELRANYTGGRQPWVVSNGAKVELMSWKPTEMDFIDSRKLTREEILAAYKVPPTVAGITENATLANAAAYDIAFWKKSALPVLDNIRGVFNRVLVPFFGNPETLMLDYDLSGVQELRQDEDARSQVLERLRNCGVPLNVAKDLLDYDFDDIEGGDIPLVPGTLMPLDMLVETAEQALRMGDATIENTEANTETTLKPPKDPNKPQAPPRAA
jgi:HK97 family phage portal protein